MSSSTDDVILIKIYNVFLIGKQYPIKDITERAVFNHRIETLITFDCQLIGTAQGASKAALQLSDGAHTARVPELKSIVERDTIGGLAKDLRRILVERVAVLVLATISLQNSRRNMLEDISHLGDNVIGRSFFISGRLVDIRTESDIRLSSRGSRSRDVVVIKRSHRPEDKEEHSCSDDHCESAVCGDDVSVRRNWISQPIHCDGGILASVSNMFVQWRWIWEYKMALTILVVEWR